MLVVYGLVGVENKSGAFPGPTIVGRVGPIELRRARAPGSVRRTSKCPSKSSVRAHEGAARVLEPPSTIQPGAHPPGQSQPADLLCGFRSALSPGPLVAGPALAGTARRFAGPDRTPAGAGAALLGGSGWSGESLLRSFGGPGTGGDDGQAPGQPLPAGAAVSGLAEDQAAPDSGDQRQRNRKGPATGERWRNGGQIRGTSSITGTNRNRVISELVLTAVTKFLVSFGELVDTERKIATVSARSTRQMLGSWRPKLICHRYPVG